MDGSSRSAREIGRFLLRSGVRYITETAVVAFPVVTCDSDRAITSVIGRKEARPRFRISLYSVAGTIERCTRKATESIDTRTASFASAARPFEFFPKFHCRPASLTIPLACYD